MRGMSMVSLVEFEAIFESAKNWGRWGPNDELGTLNYTTSAKVREAAALVRTSCIEAATPRADLGPIHEEPRG